MAGYATFDFKDLSIDSGDEAFLENVDQDTCANETNSRGLTTFVYLPAVGDATSKCWVKSATAAASGAIVAATDRNVVTKDAGLIQRIKDKDEAPAPASDGQPRLVRVFIRYKDLNTVQKCRNAGTYWKTKYKLDKFKEFKGGTNYECIWYKKA